MLDAKLILLRSNIITMFDKDEIAYFARKFYDNHKHAPRLKDIQILPFSKKQVIDLFGSWSSMLRYAQLPLNRNPPQLVKCANCSRMFKKQVKEMRKSLKHFCSCACNAQYYTTGRKHTQATKDKISSSLKAHRIFAD